MCALTTMTLSLLSLLSGPRALELDATELATKQLLTTSELLAESLALGTRDPHLSNTSLIGLHGPADHLAPDLRLALLGPELRRLDFELTIA